MSHGNRLAKAATGVVVYGGYSGKAAAAGSQAAQTRWRDLLAQIPKGFVFIFILFL
jgi:hypothetical protein